MEMAAWLIPYTSGLFKLESACLRFLTQKRDNRQWLGTIDSLIALAYLRFRPGAKLHIRGFKITNDHSHQLQIRDYQLDFQGIKRSILGGSSMDLINLKTPIYYSYQILADLEPDDRQIILQLALESVIYLQEDTYAHDLSALDNLHSIQLLLTEMLKVYGNSELGAKAVKPNDYGSEVGSNMNAGSNSDAESNMDAESNSEAGSNSEAESNVGSDAGSNSENEEPEKVKEPEKVTVVKANDVVKANTVALKPSISAKPSVRSGHRMKKFPDSQLESYLCVKSDYLEHPYTQENLLIWKNNLPLLREICHQFKQAHERYLHGGAYEENLNQIRESANRMRHMMNSYVENIEKI